jgi:hypothetical protein
MGFIIAVVWNMWTSKTNSIFNGNFPSLYRYFLKELMHLCFHKPSKWLRTFKVGFRTLDSLPFLSMTIRFATCHPTIVLSIQVMLHGVFLVIEFQVTASTNIIHKHWGFAIVKRGTQHPYNQMKSIMRKDMQIHVPIFFSVIKVLDVVYLA